MKSHVVVARAALEEARAVCSAASEAEDGGSFLGCHLVQEGGVAVVLTRFVPGGPGAVRRPSWFEPDVDHLNAQAALEAERSGARFQGNVHVHFLDPEPSIADLRAALTAREAGYEVFAQIIYSKARGSEGELHGFLLTPEGSGFEPVALFVLEPDGSVRPISPALAPRADRLVVLDRALDEVERRVAEGATSGFLFGRALGEEGLTQVFAATPVSGLPGEVVGVWLADESESPASAFTALGAWTHVVAGGSWAQATVTGLARGEPEIVATDRDAIQTRSQGLADLGALAGKHVVFVGCGSIGSEIALDLAPIVGRMTLVERAGARLGVENVCRHALDLTDVGRSKATALRDRLLRTNPALAVAARELDVADDPDAALELLREADLAIVSTDVVSRQVLYAALAREAGTPLVMPWAYEYGDAGEVFVQLNDGPGYAETFPHRAASGREPLFERPFRYADVAGPDEALQGSPGLRIDLKPIVATASAFALALLDPGNVERAPIVSASKPLVLLHSGRQPKRLAHMFLRPFERVVVEAALAVDGAPAGTPLG